MPDPNSDPDKRPSIQDLLYNAEIQAMLYEIDQRTAAIERKLERDISFERQRGFQGKIHHMKDIRVKRAKVGTFERLKIFVKNKFTSGE